MQLLVKTLSSSANRIAANSDLSGPWLLPSVFRNQPPNLWDSHHITAVPVVCRGRSKEVAAVVRRKMLLRRRGVRGQAAWSREKGSSVAERGL